MKLTKQLCIGLLAISLVGCSSPEVTTISNSPGNLIKDIHGEEGKIGPFILLTHQTVDYACDNMYVYNLPDGMSDMDLNLYQLTDQHGWDLVDTISYTTKEPSLDGFVGLTLYIPDNELDAQIVDNKGGGTTQHLRHIIEKKDGREMIVPMDEIAEISDGKEVAIWMYGYQNEDSDTEYRLSAFEHPETINDMQLMMAVTLKFHQ